MTVDQRAEIRMVCVRVCLDKVEMFTETFSFRRSHKFIPKVKQKRNPFENLNLHIASFNVQCNIFRFEFQFARNLVRLFDERYTHTEREKVREIEKDTKNISG